MAADVRILVPGRATDRLRVFTPYHPGFSAKARALGGKWNAETRCWTFDQRDTDRVRDLCRTLFGTDGSAPVEQCTITARIGPETHGVSGQLSFYGELWLAGRRVAARLDRDRAVLLGEGVIVLSGGFPSFGGSRATPALNPLEDTVLEIRDVPAVLAHKEVEQHAGIVALQVPDAAPVPVEER